MLDVNRADLTSDQDDLGLCFLGMSSDSLWFYIFKKIVRREVKDH